MFGTVRNSTNSLIPSLTSLYQNNCSAATDFDIGDILDYFLPGKFTNSTDVVEYPETNDDPPSYGKIPQFRGQAIGAMLDTTPIVCGGISDNGNLTDYGNLIYNDCIAFQNGQWNVSHTMQKYRFIPAGVKINSTTFWILGGMEELPWFLTRSTEFIIQGQTNGVTGPDLPYTLYSSCAVKLSEEEIFVIGGVSRIWNGIRREVWIYNPQNGFTLKQGPPLNVARGGHSCSTMRDGDKTYIIVAGGNYFPNLSLQEHTLNSTEIYDPEAKTWYLGKQIPNQKKTKVK